MSGIFISYRRGDTAGYAGRLFDALRDAFGRERVFMDVAGSIEPGVDFAETIRSAVGSCEALIVVIGPTWLTVAGADGERRLDDPEDWIRLEVATALRRNIRVVPVLVDGAEMPKTAELPDDLKALSRRNAIELSPTRWDFDVEALAQTLRGVLREDERTPWIKWAAAVLAAAAVAALLAWGLWPTPPPPPPPVDQVRDTPEVPVEPPPPPRITVPDLIGQPFEEAETRLLELSLQPVRVDKVSTSDPEETVLSQNPAPGADLPKGSEIQVTVATYPVRSDEGNQVAEMVFCLQKHGLKCEKPVFEDTVNLSSLPLGEIESGKPIRVLYFFSVAKLTDLGYVLHVWDRDLQEASQAGEQCQTVNSEHAGAVTGGKDCLIVWMEVEQSDKYRLFSVRSVPGPGLYSAEVQDSDRWRLFGSKRRTIRVVDDSAAASEGSV